MKLKHLFLPSLALGGAALLLGPAPTSEGYSLIGGSLSTAQRDFRIFNNFTDATANNNQVPDPQFPGHQGAVMAIWKAGIEWGSELHGNGTGDSTQPGGLGSGGANFDAHFQGDTNGIGTTNNNIHSEISGGSGGVLAFAETPISDGWRIRYYASWTWQDGPGSVFSGIDLQGVACHEYGHALGLGHSTAGGSPTMAAFLSGSGSAQRSIATDDMNGVQAIYGVKSATKPKINGVSVSGGTVTITGEDFSTAGNEVWFTNGSITSTGVDPTVKLTGVASTGGGTVITTGVPFGAGPGDVLVKKSASGNSSLSNAWPVDVMGDGGGGGLAITGISPSNVDALNVGSGQVVTISGTGFTSTTTVEVDGNPLFGIPSPYTIVNSTTITFDPPDAPQLGSVEVKVIDGGADATSSINYVVNDPPALQAGNGDEPVTFFTAGGLDITCAGAPGDTFLLIASSSNLPSVVPGFFSLDIGNNLSNVFLLSQPTLNSEGLASFNLPTTLPPFTTFFLQGLTVDAGFSLPLPNSNAQEVQALF
ncbi:MAG: matrixin family metalloprotease [Planctomycetota bacterium]